MILASLYLAAAASTAGCHVVTDDVIRMRDLAAADAAFSSLDADSVVAYAPLPGSVRILQVAQLTRLAQRHGIGDSDFRDVCFQRAMRQLGEQELLDGLRSAPWRFPVPRSNWSTSAAFPPRWATWFFPARGWRSLRHWRLCSGKATSFTEGDIISPSGPG